MSSFTLERFNQFEGFSKDIGIVMTKAANGEAEGYIDLTTRHYNPIGSVHGGCLFALADTVAGSALASTGVTCTTLSSHIEYLKGAMRGVSHRIIAEGTPVRVGRKIAVYEVKIKDEHGTLICKVTVDFFIMSDKYSFDFKERKE